MWQGVGEALPPSSLRTEQSPLGGDPGFSPSRLHQRPPLEADGKGTGSPLGSLKEPLLAPGPMESQQGRVVGASQI